MKINLNQVQEIYHDNILGVEKDQHHISFEPEEHQNTDHRGIPGVPIVDDTVVDVNKVWSSDKIMSVVNSAAGAIINDSVISTSSTWSSDKINTELTNLQNQITDNNNAINGLIDDTVIVTDKTWSSSKINTELTNLQNAINNIIDDNNIATTSTYSSSKIDNDFEKISNKGVANGYCPLNANGKIDPQYLQISALIFKGYHDASTGNYPTTTPNPQEYWWISTAGTIDGVEYNVDDFIIYVDDTVGWVKQDNTERVLSVAGKTGNITLIINDISDISVANPNDGQALIYDANTGLWTNKNITATGGASSLDELSDVTITSPSDNQVLSFDGTNNIWVNKTIDLTSIIDDTITATDKTWSSDKINSELNSLQNDISNIINDSTVSTTTTWSSNKINNELDTKAEIRDTVTSNTTTWSSYKINSEITNKTEIDDANIATTTTWSSDKINTEIQNVQSAVDNLIDDNNIVTDKTWSSNKINTELTSKAEIDDTVTVADKTWSSNKINTELTNLQNDIDSIIDDNNTATTTTWSSSKISNEIAANAITNYVKTDGDSLPTQDATFDIGNDTHRYNNIYAVTFQGTATSALYADLAEKYSIREDANIGDVIVVSRDEDVDCEISKDYNSESVLGIVSENPAFKMNSGLKDGKYIALVGRVPCKVMGNVRKGDALVSGPNGCAVSINTLKENGIISSYYFILGIANETVKQAFNKESIIEVILK